MPRQRWNQQTGKRAYSPIADEFLDDLFAVFKKHGLSLAHEDHQGAFLIEEFKDRNVEWLQAAHLNVGNT